MQQHKSHMSNHEALDVYSRFCRVIDQIHGVFLDATVGMGQHARQLMAADLTRLQSIPRGIAITPEELNPTIVYSGQIGSQDADLHTTSLHEVIARNTVDGANWDFLAQMCVAAAYGYWEDFYRGALATALQVEKKVLLDDVFGELGALRHAIIHNNGRSTSKVARNKILPRFGIGTHVALTSQHIHDLMDETKRGAHRLLQAKPDVPAA